MASINRFAAGLPLVALALCLTAGLLIFALGNWQTGRLATAESERLGRALTSQLVETIRQPVLHNDLVSLQVSVDRLVKRAEVAGAAIHNAHQRQLAQSDAGNNAPQSEFKKYREALLIEGKTVAYAGVAIDTSALLARYRQPLNWILSVWAGFTVIAVGICYLLGRGLSKRISALIARLPGEKPPEVHCNELDALERQLQPLLTQNREPKPGAPPRLQVATMALHCKNLSQLERHLSKDKLQRLLNKLDDDLNQIATLYDGQRRAGHDQTLFIEFSGDLADGDHPARALSCTHILLELVGSYARSQGVAMELSAAVKLSSGESSGALLNDFEREKRETEVARLARQGKVGETLVDSSISLHQALDGVLTTEEVSESSDLHRVASFATHHQAILEKQLRYLVERPA